MTERNREAVVVLLRAISLGVAFVAVFGGVIMSNSITSLTIGLFLTSGVLLIVAGLINALGDEE